MTDFRLHRNIKTGELSAIPSSNMEVGHTGGEFSDPDTEWDISSLSNLESGIVRVYVNSIEILTPIKKENDTLTVSFSEPTAGYVLIISGT